jgi:phage terminase Nu1 subunit (DNA packaging protein)
MVSGLSSPCTQEQFAAVVGITQPRVAQLIDEGILPRAGTAGQWLQAYVSRLAEQAAGRGHELTIERAALARSQRVAQEIKNDAAHAMFAPAALLAEVLAAASAHMDEQMARLASGLASQFPQLDPAARAVVLQTIASARAEWARSTAELVAPVFDDLAAAEDGESLPELPPDDLDPEPGP